MVIPFFLSFFLLLFLLVSFFLRIVDRIDHLHGMIYQQDAGQDNKDKSRCGEEEENLSMQIFEEGHC